MHDKTKGVAGYTEYFCYVLSRKLTSEDGSYLLFAVLGIYGIASPKKEMLCYYLWYVISNYESLLILARSVINREDMLELTRRMTVIRSCFDRIAGAYINDMGEVDESFNIHFGKLSDSEKAKNLKLAKTIPFLKTNVQLKEYEFAVFVFHGVYDVPLKGKDKGNLWESEEVQIKKN